MSKHSVGTSSLYPHLRNDAVFGEWEIPPWELLIMRDRLLGSGSFANVYLAKWRETLVVAKVFNAYCVSEKGFLMEREIEIMTKLHHPNIVQILGYVNDPFVIVLEYVPRGDLSQNIHRLGFSSKMRVAKDCLRALCYLHNRKPDTLIHRDVKPSNILLTTSGMAKIADFGLSRLAHASGCHAACGDDLSSNAARANESSDLTKSVGTRRYQAPEMPCTLYTHKVDIYSLGVALYELFEGRQYDPEIGFRWRSTPRSVRKIVQGSMLCRDPLMRMGAKETLKCLEGVEDTATTCAVCCVQ